MKKLFAAACLAALLSACGTSVPLNNVPVTDVSAKPVQTTQPAAGTTAVVPVDLGKASLDAGSAASRTVYFDYDSYVIKPEFQSIIAKQAGVAKATPARKLAIEGHTDERGGREYNLALGQKRADAVRSALTLLGVPTAQIESVSFGKEKPAVTGADETAFAKNRRAEIRYQ